MKKTKDTNTTTETPKRERTKKKFFLYVDGKGFVRFGSSSTPSFDKGEILCYTSFATAKFAREFFISIQLADSIDILAKVA